MGRSALILVMALALGALAPAWAQDALNASANATTQQRDATEATNRILGYSAWDDDFLYLAFQVNKPTLRGTNAQPYSNPLEDDALLIGIQTDNDRKASQRTEKTFTLAVSAFGGFQFYSGAQSRPLFRGLEDFQAQFKAIQDNEKDPQVRAAKTAALFGKIIKKEVIQKGSLRPIGTPASGYTVEVAIPWTLLGGRPETGTTFGFLVSARSVTTDSPPIQSLSPRVQTANDLENPSAWFQLALRNAPAEATADALTAPRIVGNRPIIDGELGNGEWIGLSGFSFGLQGNANGLSALSSVLAARTRAEFKPAAPRPVVPVAPVERISLPDLPRKAQKIAPLVLARYFYDYQGDPRKSVPTARIWRPDGATALAAHPLNGAGPWFSYDRADWHRTQLSEARRAGVDVILPVYRADARSRQTYADKGLLNLTTALQYLEQTGQDYPHVGLFLDTTSLSAGAQEGLYAAIRDFYRRIPARFRYGFALSRANGGRVAYPVFLSDAAPLGSLDAAAIQTLRARFAAEFEGADLLLLGESGLQGKTTLDGYFADSKEKGVTYQTGWVSVATIGAGYDSSLNSDNAILRSRRNSDAYRENWLSALARKPNWILLDGWNDYANGAAIAPTVQSGYRDLDLTRIYSQQFAVAQKSAVKMMAHNVPARFAPQSVWNVWLRLQNQEMEAWGVGQGVTPLNLLYVWKRGEQVVSTGTVTPMRDPFLPGEARAVPFAIRAADAEGDYTLEIMANRKMKRGEWSEVLLSQAVQVRKSGADWAATLVRTNLPTMLETGSVYTVQATLRNDGTATWRKADGARVTLRLVRNNSSEERVLATADATAELPNDTPPGAEATVELKLPLLTPSGEPLPTWNAEDSWSYSLHWEVAADGKRGVMPVAQQNGETTTQGVRFAPSAVAIVPFDFGVQVVTDKTRAALPAQKRLPMLLTLKNAGAQTWKADKVRIGYHWYYADGTEFLWEDETTALPKDVAPGETAKELLCYVTAPPYNGTYYLVWDVKVGDAWVSTGSASRVFDQSLNRVEVTGDRLNFADLTPSYNLDGVTDADNRQNGDFNGAGETFPSELVPPFADMTIAPATLWMTVGKSGPDSPRRIAFRWGQKEPGAKNFIACRGQRIYLGKSSGQCATLHLLAATSSKNFPSSLRLIFEEPTGTSEDQYAFFASPWDGKPQYGEEVAFVSRRRHTRSGVEDRPVQLYHYTLRVRQPRKLIGLQLPNAPDLKIAAITLER